MKRLALAALACVLVFPAAAAASPVSSAGAELRHMQLVMGMRPSPQLATWTQLRVHPRRVFQEQRVLLGSLLYTRHVFAHPPHESAWRCLYRYEHGRGGWASNTGNSYYGGLQMDVGFQRTYGGYLFRVKGTADRWSSLEQMWTAEHALPSRGFHPWPRTARICKLL